jgi:hypothetical protein
MLALVCPKWRTGLRRRRMSGCGWKQQAWAASARQATAARAEAAQQGVAQMLLVALVAEEAQRLAAEANAAVCADRARLESESCRIHDVRRAWAKATTST